MKNQITIPHDEANLENYIKNLQKAEKAFDQAAVYSRILQGAALEELRKLHDKGEKGGRPKTSEKFGGFIPWPLYVKKTFGFSDDTARLRIRLWVAARPRLKKLAEEMQQGLSEIFNRPISQLEPEKLECLQKVTRELTDGEDMELIQQELGLWKKPMGHKLVEVNPDGTDAVKREYHATKADGSPRAPRRTDEEMLIDEAAGANWKMEYIKLLHLKKLVPYTPDEIAAQLHGFLYDLYQESLTTMKHRGLKMKE